jgi:hypothetical protein
MTKYRKKPVVVEAIQWKGNNVNEVIEFSKGNIKQHVAYERNEPINTIYLSVSTLEGEMLASPKDFIIKGINGEFYPCKPDIFAKTYERVD